MARLHMFGQSESQWVQPWVSTALPRSRKPYGDIPALSGLQYSGHYGTKEVPVGRNRMVQGGRLNANISCGNVFIHDP